MNYGGEGALWRHKVNKSVLQVYAELLGYEFYYYGRQQSGFRLQSHGLQLFLIRLTPSVQGVKTHAGLIGQFLFSH